MNKTSRFIALALSIAGSLFLLSTTVRAEHASCQSAPLLEIRYDAFGMLAPQGKFLYVRVCPSRKMEYEIEGEKPWTKKLRSQELTLAEFSSLAELIDSEQFKKLHGTYGTRREVRDYNLQLNIHIRRAGEFQAFQLLSLPSTSGSDPSPQGAADLFCLVDRFRRADFNVAHNCNPPGGGGQGPEMPISHRGLDAPDPCCLDLGYDYDSGEFRYGVQRCL